MNLNCYLLIVLCLTNFQKAHAKEYSEKELQQTKQELKQTEQFLDSKFKDKEMTLKSCALPKTFEECFIQPVKQYWNNPEVTELSCFCARC